MERWEEATGALEAGARAMREGEMLSAREFTLQGAMCASDIMDPRMDAGWGAARVASVPERLAAGAIPAAGALSARQALHVVDYLTRAEAAWLAGAGTLAQTLWTCLYLHPRPRAELLQGAGAAATAVRACVAAAMRESALLLEAARDAGVHAEEDFSLQLPGFGPVDADVPPADQALADLAAAEDALRHQYRASAGAADAAAWEALAARAKLRRATLQAVTDLGACSLEAARRSVKGALAALEHCVGGAELAEEPRGVYEAQIARRVENPLPLRGAVALPGLGEAAATLRGVLEEAARACAAPGGDSLTTLAFWLEQYSATEPGALARSWLLLMLRAPQCCGGRSMRERVADSLLAFPLPAAYVRDAAAEELLGELERVWGLTLEMMCCNRSRIRRKVFELLRHWDGAQSLAIEADAVLMTKCPPPSAATADPATASGVRRGALFMTYASFFKFTYMVLYLRLGIELQLLADRELTMAFWYMDFLQGMRRSQYAELRTVVLAMGRRAKPRPRGKKPAPAPEEPSPACALLSLLEAEFLTTRAFFRLLSALHSYGAARRKAPLFGSEEALFEYRFRPFQYFIIPQPLLYSHWLDTADYTKYPGDTLIGGSLESFKAAKAFLMAYQQQIAEREDIPLVAPNALQSWLRVLVVNMINIQLILASPARNEEEFRVDNSPLFDWSLSKVFPTISLPKIRRI